MATIHDDHFDIKCKSFTKIVDRIKQIPDIYAVRRVMS